MQVISLDLFRAISRLARRYQFRNRDEVCCYGMTVSQCYALQELSGGEAMATSELAQGLTLDLSTTTRLLDQLVKKRLVRRERQIEDGRIKEITLTEAGARLLNQVEREFSLMLHKALVDFPMEVQEALPDVLQRIASALENCDRNNF